jgi:hypothetical protein
VAAVLRLTGKQFGVASLDEGIVETCPIVRDRVINSVLVAM